MRRVRSLLRSASRATTCFLLVCLVAISAAKETRQSLIDALGRIEAKTNKKSTPAPEPSASPPDPPNAPPKPREYDAKGEPVDQTFTLYTLSDFHTADKVSVYTIRTRGGAERHRGALQKIRRGRFEEKGEGIADPTGPPAILSLHFEESRFYRDGARTAGGDQYVTLEFVDGASVWYKQPRARPNRDRADTWIRGGEYTGASIFGQSGQVFKQAANMYPEQIKFTRGRMDDDPDHDVDYSGTLSRAKTAVILGGVLATIAIISASLVLGPAVAAAVSASGWGTFATAPVALTAVEMAKLELTMGAVGVGVARGVVPAALAEAAKMTIDHGLNGI